MLVEVGGIEGLRILRREWRKRVCAALKRSQFPGGGGRGNPMYGGGSV